MLVTLKSIWTYKWPFIIIDLAGVIWIGSIRIRKLQNEVAAKEAAYIVKDLEALGYKVALEGKEKDITSITPSIPTSPIAKSAPSIATRIITERVEVPIPSPCSLNDTTPTPQPTINLGIQSEVQLRMDIVRDKRLWEGKVFSDLTIPSLNYAQRVEQPLTPTSQVVVEKKLADIIRAGLDKPSKFALTPRPIRHWRAGWMVGVDPICSINDTTICPVVAWGVQF